MQCARAQMIIVSWFGFVFSTGENSTCSTVATLKSWEWPGDEAIHAVQLDSSSFRFCTHLYVAVKLKMNPMIYAWLCSLTVAFVGFMWGYEAG